MTTPNPTAAERDARALCDELYWIACSGQRMSDERLDAYRTTIRASRDTAWRAAIEGLRMEHTHGCNEARREYLRDAWADEDAFECVCRAAVWNAALSALADRMGVT